MRRGRIIQYNPNAGTGIVLVGDAQRAFEIRHWRGGEAPQLNRVTDVHEEDGVVTVLSPVPESVLLGEKAAELKAGLGTLGANLGALGATVGATVGASLRARADGTGGAAGVGAADPAGAPLAGGVPLARRLDRPVVAGYALFVVATALLTFVSIRVPFLGDRDLTLLAATGMAEQFGSSARLLLLAAYLSVLVPLLWKDRRGWLALAAPILSLAVMLWSVNGALGAGPAGADAADMAAFLGEDAMREMRRAAAEMFSFGAGMYASVLAGLYLAALGARRFLGRA